MLRGCTLPTCTVGEHVIFFAEITKKPFRAIKPILLGDDLEPPPDSITLSN